MYDIYQKFQSLHLDTSWIGLDTSCINPTDDIEDHYYCTPLGAKIIGWDNDIHYCFIQGFKDMIFCVDPMSCCDYYVYPIAKNFYDFLSLILATKHTNVMQQVILWNRQAYEDYINSPDFIEYISIEDVKHTLDTLRIKLDMKPFLNPFEYIKEIQKDFSYQSIPFRDEYYIARGIDR